MKVRRALDALYDAAGYLAALFMLGTLACVLLGIGSRVTLILENVGVKARRSLELWSLAAGSALASLFAYYSARLAFQSWDFNDISTGNDATPLWIPQLSMAAGSLVLAIAFVDALVLEWRGKRARAAPAEVLHVE